MIHLSATHTVGRSQGDLPHMWLQENIKYVRESKEKWKDQKGLDKSVESILVYVIFTFITDDLSIYVAV